jgi:hypothetical protein
MKPVLPILITIIGFLTLWIFSDHADAKEVAIIRGGQQTTIEIVDNDEALERLMEEVTK